MKILACVIVALILTADLSDLYVGCWVTLAARPDRIGIVARIRPDGRVVVRFPDLSRLGGEVDVSVKPELLTIY